MLFRSSCRGVRKSFGSLAVLNGVDLEVEVGQKVVLLGPSGSGKSTLLRCMNRLETPEEGEIRLFGRSLGVGGRELASLRAEVGMVFQGFHLFPHLTVLENIVLPQMLVRGLRREAAVDRARSLLGRVGMGHKGEAWPAQLSGGQQQRVAIARALALEPRALLFDEPTSALDPEMVQEVLEVMNDIAAQGMTMVVVTHEMHFAEQVADRIVFMDGGKVVEDAPPARFFLRPETERARTFLSHLRVHRRQTEALRATGYLGDRDGVPS